MKIAMIGHKHLLSREGGVEIVVNELSTRMARLGYNVTVYDRNSKDVMEQTKKYKKINEYKGVKIKRVLTIDKKGLAAVTSSFFGTVRILFSDAEVVHYHAEGPSAWLWILKFFSKKKIVVTIHGLNWQSPKWKGFASKYIKFGEKVAVKYADEIIVLNNETKDYFKKVYNRDTVFIPNGVNKPIIEKANIIKEKYGLDKDGYILFLGRIEPVKGIHFLIEAYKRLKTDKKLVIAGASSEVNDYFDELQALSNNDIIFTGYVCGKLLDELYSNAYLYVLPSVSEGMPLSLLEAMSYGNCCITSDIKSCTEVLGDKGVYFANQNKSDLYIKLKKLLSDDLTVEKYKKQSQNYILSRYNWDDTVQKTLELYRK